MTFTKLMRAATMALLALLSGPIMAQNYPSKPVRLVVTYPPGGTLE